METTPQRQNGAVKRPDGVLSITAWAYNTKSMSRALHNPYFLVDDINLPAHLAVSRWFRPPTSLCSSRLKTASHLPTPHQQYGSV
jgi:hypothetical protein